MGINDFFVQQAIEGFLEGIQKTPIRIVWNNWEILVGVKELAKRDVKGRAKVKD